MIAWHSLVTSLDKATRRRTVGRRLLTAATAGRRSTRTSPSRTRRAPRRASSIRRRPLLVLVDRGPVRSDRRQIKIPTLIVQGTVDNLFTLDEGITNYRPAARPERPDRDVVVLRRARRVPHESRATRPASARTTMAWLNRYVKRDTVGRDRPRFRLRRPERDALHRRRLSAADRHSDRPRADRARCSSSRRRFGSRASRRGQQGSARRHRGRDHAGAGDERGRREGQLRDARGRSSARRS